jgi:hypothetical protein
MTPIVVAWLQAQGLLVKREVLLWSYCDLIGCELDWDMVNRRENRRKGWRPLHRRIIAVELKLSKVAAVLRQARENRPHVDESYVAVPLDVVVSRVPKTDWNGIGLIGVGQEGCQVLIPAQARHGVSHLVDHQVEKFWRERYRLRHQPALKEAVP